MIFKKKRLLNRNTFNCTWNFAHEHTLFMHVRCAVKFIILQCMIPFEAWVCTQRYFTVFTEGLCLVPLYRPIATHLTIRVCLSATRGEIRISAHKMSPPIEKLCFHLVWRMFFVVSHSLPVILQL